MARTTSTIRRCNRVRIEDDGSGLRGVREPDFLSSSDPNFRPVASNTGPDGAVYLADWHSPVISHTLVNHLRDPNRGPEYGRTDAGGVPSPRDRGNDYRKIRGVGAPRLKKRW